MNEHPRKRSNPAQLQKEREAIVKDMESRLLPDTEDPEVSEKRRKKYGSPPVIRGGAMIGFKKNTSPV